MNDFFDQTLADNVYSLVSKMDDDTAEMFTRVLADEIHEDLVAKNQRLIAEQNSKIIAKTLDAADKVCTSLIAQGRDEEAVAVAYAARAGVQDEIEIIKAKRQDRKPGWNQGEKGRFVRSEEVPLSRTRHIKRVEAIDPVSNIKPIKLVSLKKPIQAPASRAKNSGEGEKSRLKPYEDRRDGKKEYATIRSGDFLPTQDRLKAGEKILDSKGRPLKILDADGKETAQDDWAGRRGGQYKTGQMMGSPLEGDRYHKDTGRFVQAQQDVSRFAVDRAEDIRRPMQNMAINEAAMLRGISPGGFEGARGAGTKLQSTFDQDRDWTPSEPAERSNVDRTWNTMQAAGMLASGIGGAGAAVGVPYSQTLAYAGEAAQVAGKLGPGGERIVGPSVRRTIYRYQGVERKQEPALKAEVLQAKKRVLNAKMDRMPRNRRDEASGALFSRTAKLDDFLTVEDRHEASRMAAVNFLRERLPDARRNTLREGSGKIAPSEGIIIGKDGKIKHQTVGVAEDHYLPFKHSNLKSMKGGTYIRTRTLGGLTTEDIRTGLMTGVNSIIVISHSGVFQVDFDPEFTKRDTSRAKKMVDRYGRILDAVQSEKVTKTPLSRMEQAEIAEQLDEWVKRQVGGAKPEEIKEKAQQLRKEAMERPRLTKEEQEGIAAFARQGYSPGELDTEQTMRKVRIAERSLYMQALQAKGERHYALNGNGYKAALETLRDEFPYFIQVNSEVDHDDVFGSIGLQNTDSGYVKPRFLHPEREQHGYFGENIDSSRGKAGSKRRGDSTEYQNYRYNKDQKFLTRSEEDDRPKGEKNNESGQGNRDQGNRGRSSLEQRENEQIDLKRANAAVPPNTLENVNAVVAQASKVANSLSQSNHEVRNAVAPFMAPVARWNDTSESGKTNLLTNSQFVSELLDAIEGIGAVIPSADKGGADALKNMLGGQYSKNIRLEGTPAPLIPMRFASDDRRTLRNDATIRDNVASLKKTYGGSWNGNIDNELREMSNKVRQSKGDYWTQKVLAIELTRYELKNKLDAEDGPKAVESDYDWDWDKGLRELQRQ